MNISEINIYPIKSLGGINLRNSVVARRGLRFDRRWMLVDQAGGFFTQREVPKMAAIRVALAEDNLMISAFGFEDLLVPIEFEGETIEVKVWKSVCQAILQSAEINLWFSEVLQKRCNLVYMPEESERGVNPIFNMGKDIVSFADGYPLLVIGEHSLLDLNSRLETEIPMNRFRPNIVVSGSPAFAEDGWKKIRIGDTVFRSTKPSERCIVTTVDQKNGTFTGKEPLKTLARYRMAKDVFPETYQKHGIAKTSVLFGQNLIAENYGGEIRVGNEVTVL